MVVSNGFSFTQTSRHWHASSQTYAFGDQLARLLEEGWQITNVAVDIHHIRSRRIRVYYFRLQKGDEQQEMAIVGTPWLERVIRELAAQNKKVEQAEQIEQTQAELSAG